MSDKHMTAPLKRKTFSRLIEAARRGQAQAYYKSKYGNDEQKKAWALKAKQFQEAVDRALIEADRK